MGTVELSLNYGGIKLKNPVIVGSAENVSTARGIQRAAAGGAAGVVTKTQHLTLPGDDRPYTARRLRRYRFINCENGAERDYDPKLTERGAYFTLVTPNLGGLLKSEDIVPEIQKARDTVDIPIFASIAGVSLKEYEDMAAMNREAGADAIEVLDPHHYAVLAGSVAFPDFTIYDAIRVVRRTVNLPISAKCAFAWDNPEKTLNALRQAGANMVTAVGEMSLPALEIDVEKGEPWYNMQMGCYGSWFKPASLSWVARAAKVGGLPISGVSGITKWNHAVEYIMAGASTVQLSSILFARGFKVAGEIVQGMREFMERKGYSNLEELRGIAIGKIRNKRDLFEEYTPMVASVDEMLCTACGECEDVCYVDAISVQDGTARVDPDKCIGCELCVSVCPEDSLSLKLRSDVVSSRA
jgi:dihydroorotate dehydrogenase/NAD-dependent dihydropyrimidine dehydrogenase PreA subunit